MRASTESLQRALDHLNAGRLDQAEALLKRALAKAPRDPDANHIYALLLGRRSRPDQAEYYLRAAIAADPARSEFHVALGNLLALHRPEPAAEAFRRALGLDPDDGPAHLGLAVALVRLLDYDGAADAAASALRLRPDTFEPYVNLASVLKESGRVEESLAVLRDARARFPTHIPVFTAQLTTLNYHDGTGPEEIARACRQFAAIMPGPPPPDLTGQDPDRRLRIGYLSGDFRTHSVAFFIEPILGAHDRANVEVFCYSTSHRSDAITERLRSLADTWVDVSRMDTEEFLRRTASDRIDILVDLSGHTSNSRLPALARRAAPIQVTYLGYPGSTGIPAVGYRLVDSRTDPPGAEGFVTETLVRLDPCFLCYRPFDKAPEIAPPPPPPRDREGSITFGSFNSWPKHSPSTLALWADILRDVPSSRLVLKNRVSGDPNVRRRIHEAFAARGVDPERVELLPHAPTQADHLRAYSRVDIALDTFPYNGTTTTCEALWMGVPVVALEGRTHAGRVGASLLHTVGLDDLIAAAPDDYRRIAVGLAAEPGRLAELRSGLRGRVARSPLCDAPAFARRLEAAYRAMWRRAVGAPSEMR